MTLLQRTALRVGLLLTIAGPATAQAAPQAVLDSMVASVTTADSPATGIAVVYQGRVVYQRVTGWSDLAHHVPANADTRFDWASIAKQFTAYGISQLVSSGALDLDVPASRYLPELAALSDDVTLRTLIHHTAGLEDSDGLLVLSGFRPSDRLTLTEVAGVMLRQRHLRFRPGDAHGYSNGGYVLLAEVIARVSGMPFASWMHDQVFAPLGMTQSGFARTPAELVPNTARPYLRRDGVIEDDLSADYAGAGGLRATVDDMARWAIHVMEPATQLEATHRLRTRGVLRNGDSLNYAWGLGWNVHRGIRILTHGGSTPAVDAFVLMAPDDQFAVVAVAAGQVSPNPAAMAFRALELWLADRLQPVQPTTGPRMMMISEEQMVERPPESRGVEVAEAVLTAAVGRYRTPTGDVHVIRRGGDRLEIGANGVGPWWPLNPLPDGTFITMPLRRVHAFERGPSGEVTAIRIGQAGTRSTSGPTRAVREAERQFSAADAAPYLGWYYSEETLAWFEVVLTGHRLALRHPRLGTLPMVPLSDTEFGIDSHLVARATFLRDGRSGRVGGMVLQAFSWGVQVAFTRRQPEAPAELESQ